MRATGRWTSAIAGGAIAAFAAIPTASAQTTTQFYSQCGTDGGGQACYAALLSLTGSTLTVSLQNNGPTPSRITGFGLFDMVAANGLLSADLVTTAPQTGFFNGQTNTVTALPTGFIAGTNEPNGLDQPGAPIFQEFVDFNQGGITPCAGTVGGSGPLVQTCSNVFTQALRFTFTNVLNVTNAIELGIGVRFQSVGPNGAGSLRCISDLTGGNNCTNNPGGGLTGQIVPEPSTYVMLGTGMIALLGVASRRRRPR